jgi:hypothetical protein
LLRTRELLQGQLVAEAGFAEVRVVGIEGPGWTIVDAPGDDADARLDSALRCALLTEDFAEIVDASAHLMALATAPEHQRASGEAVESRRCRMRE